MVLLLEDDSAVIEVRDEMPEGLAGKFSVSLPSPTSIQELFTTIMNGRNYCPDSYDLFLVNDSGELELKPEEDRNLKQIGISFGSLNKNIIKIVPRKVLGPPEIVISVDEIGFESSQDVKSNDSPAGSDKDCDSESVRVSSDSNVRIPRLRQRNFKRTVITKDKPRRFYTAINRNMENCHPGVSTDFESSYSSYSLSFSRNRWNIGYVGLVNQAMTCYLNSLLQALYMTPEFRNSLYKWEFVGSPEETQKSIPYQLQKLFLSLQTSTHSAVETSKLTKSFGWDASDSWQQHDIQELCRVMFDALEQKFKDTDQADFINNLYQGKLIDYVTCLECKTEKKRIDTFLDIPLPVRPFGSTVAYNSVAEALQAFIQPETLDGNNQYFCETCNKKCDAHKGLKFSHFPYILTLHLKRFDFDYNAMTRIKLTDRVEFPQVLNINGFLCEEAKNSLCKMAGAHPEESLSPVNDEMKGDDVRMTDSASTGDDEGCQGAEPLHSSTSGSNSSGSNVDMQDYDEGIDLSNGTSNDDENEKNRRHAEGDGPLGPYIYELFSIMIHSGSASGGHYYVYIKGFDKGEWFCFDDQSVSRITNEDISMTYGGGAHRTYYSGAHSSSTNAYMLMYRQIDKRRNQAAMNVEEFPPHIKELVKKMQDEEEEERIMRERDKDRLKIKVYCHLPSESSRLESKLVIDGETTLGEATAIAYQLFYLDGIVPLERCRLVSYDSTNETMDLSFDERDAEPMSDIFSSDFFTSLYLEIREPDAQFEPYRPGGITIKVYRINMKTEEVEQPVEVRTQLTTSFGEMRPKIAKAVKLSPKIKIMMEEYGRSPIELDDEKTLQSAGFYTINKIFVAEMSESDFEVDFLEKMSAIIERFSNTITLYCNLPDTDHESLEKLGISPLPISEGAKLTNGDCGSAGDYSHTTFAITKGISRGTSPQLPPFEGEEEYLGAIGCSDQSASEDSSLTDSDRTIVGEADYCLAELSSASNSPPGSNQHSASSPEAKEPPTFLQTKNHEKVDKEEDGVTDEELLNNGYYYLNIQPSKHHKKMIRIQVDKRMMMGTLKSALANHMGVSCDNIKLFRKCRSNEIPYSGLQDPLHHLCDEEHIIVRLERALRQGEYRGKVYQLLAEDEPIKFLCDWILTKDMLVGEAKKQIVDELRRRDELDIPFDRCRLRYKKWKSPGKILLDSQSFKDLLLPANWELYVQELNEPENVTCPSQVTIILKRISSLNRAIGDFHEITLESSSFDELKETLRDICGIPLDSLQFARPSGTFPFGQINNPTQRDLQWDASCNCSLEDGFVLFYRNKDDDGSSEMKVISSSKYRSLSRKKRNKEDESSLDSKGDSGVVTDGDLSSLARRPQSHFTKLRSSKALRLKDGKSLKIVVSPTNKELRCLNDN